MLENVNSVLVELEEAQINNNVNGLRVDGFVFNACLFLSLSLYASKQFWLNPAIFFSIVMGLANGSRSANKSIHADVFLSLIFGLLITPFLLDSVDAVELWIFFRKSNVKMFEDDCADEVGLQLFAALLKISSKQSVSLGSFDDISNKSRMVESFTLVLSSLVAFSFVSDFDWDVCSIKFFADLSVEISFSVDLTSSSKSSYKSETHKL